MFKSVLIVLGLAAVFAVSGCVVVDAPRRRRVVVVERVYCR